MSSTPVDKSFDNSVDEGAPLSPSGDQPRLLKLISVSFKEAALDSPTFRASVNHLNHLIEQTEHWMEALMKLIRKYPQYYNDFKDFLGVAMDQLNPGFFNDGIIDQDYTLSALNFTRSGLISLWGDALKMLKIDDTEIIQVLNQTKQDIKAYKELRKQFEVSQSKYDLYLSRYSALSKTKEPSALREDAFQLSEVRKSYIHTSLELCIALSTIQKTLDSSIVSLSSSLWNDTEKSLIGANPQNLQLYVQLEKIKSWAKACDFSLKILSKDMLTARKQIEESAIQQFTPSRDLNDHNPSLIDPNNLLDLKDPVYEKHGWLFMKTFVGKPARQIWVRKWAFVKNGMFGLLNLSPSKMFVQETDKIGVLLCNVRYAANEDRRFCFEIKTIDTTIVFQAETLNELKFWLKVFATEKKRSIDQIDNKKKESSAFSRFPPLFSEFASTATTSADSELTSGKVEVNNVSSSKHGGDDGEGNTNSVVTSNNLSRLINTFNKSYNPDFSSYISETSVDPQFPKDGVFDEPVLNTPISTRLTKAAIISNAFLSPSDIPNAINANIWGTVNWGMYYLMNPADKEKHPSPSSQGLLVSQKEVENVSKFASSIYPPFYPKEMINYDIQMRAIFETALRSNEHCLVSFRCIWSPNSKQELSGRCFVTMDTIYFYMNSMGFVSLLMKDLNDLVSVENHFKKNWEILKVYGVDGLNMRAKIFLDDAKLIAKKLEVLINNKTAVNPASFKDLVSQLRKLDEESRQLQLSQPDPSKPVPTLDEAINDTTNTGLEIIPNNIQQKSDNKVPQELSLSSPPVVATTQNNNDLEMPSLYSIQNSQPSIKFKTDYSKEYRKLSSVREINLPAKALFHLLFGDHSQIFKEVTTMIVDGQKDGYMHLPWKITKDKKLERKLLFKLSTNSKNSLLNDKRLLDINYNGIVLGEMSELQTIHELVDNKYYNITTERSSLKLPLGAPFITEKRFIIEAIDADTCKLLIYSKLEFSRLLPSNLLVSNIYSSIYSEEVKRIVDKIAEGVKSIGNYGKINKAIKLYGQLGTKFSEGSQEVEEDSDYTTKDEGTIEFGFLLFVKLLLRVTAIRFIKFLFVFFTIIFKGIKSFIISLSMNKLSIFCLGLSIIYNFWITGKATQSFWIVKRTEKMINDYTKIASNNIVNNQQGKGKHGDYINNGGLMQRAIYLKDIEDMVKEGKILSINSSASKCFKEFQNNSFVLNYELSSLDKNFLQKQYEVTSLASVQKLQNSLQEIGIRRNELLIDLKILEKVERELAIGEWKNWVLNENNRCNFVRDEIITKVIQMNDKNAGNRENLFDSEGELNIDEILPGASDLLSYCDSCKSELQNSYLI